MELPFGLVLLTSIPTFLLGAYYLHRAKQISRYLALAFLVVIVYGMAVELLDIRTTHDYFYAKLLLMIGRDPDWMPVSIGVSWATIIFIAMVTSDRLRLPWYQRPLLDGAVAVSLDLVIDPVSSASRWVASAGDVCADQWLGQPFGGVGVWTWCVPQGDQALWYTIPLSNFSGWFAVVVAISFAIRIGARYLGAEQRSWWQQLGLLLGLAALAAGAVVGVAELYAALAQGVWSQRIVLAVAVFTPIILVAFQAKRLRFDNPVDMGLMAMPAFAFVGGLATFFIRGIDRARWPGSAILLLLVAGASAALLLSPYLGGLKRRTGEGGGA